MTRQRGLKSFGVGVCAALEIELFDGALSSCGRHCLALTAILYELRNVTNESGAIIRWDEVPGDAVNDRFPNRADVSRDDWDT
jgi:hypothetical protein